jgi:hypothetical protein
MLATRDSFPFTTKILRFSENIHSNCRFVLIFVLSLISKTSFPLISPLQIERYKVDFRYTLKYLVFVEIRTLWRFIIPIKRNWGMYNVFLKVKSNKSLNLYNKKCDYLYRIGDKSQEWLYYTTERYKGPIRSHWIGCKCITHHFLLLLSLSFYLVDHSWFLACFVLISFLNSKCASLVLDS